MYAAAVQEAAASGDLAKMKQVCQAAEAHLAEVGDVSAALQVLKVEIAKRGKTTAPPSIKPYGVAIQQAVASGDLNQMKAICQQAEEYLKNYGDISAALQVLKAEVSKLEN